MLVIFEGPDGCGKDTVMRAFNEATSYSHVTAARLHLSCLAYDQYYRRPKYQDASSRKEAEASFRRFMIAEKPLIVYLHALPHVLEQRVRTRGEDPSHGPDAKVMLEVFHHLIKDFGFTERVLELDTTFDPPLEDLAARVTGKIKALGRK